MRKLTKRKDILEGPLLKLPFLGHLPFLDKKQPWNTLEGWKDDFGSMYSIKLGSVKCVVMSDVTLVKEALKLRAFSGSPKVGFGVHEDDAADNNEFKQGQHNKSTDLATSCFKTLDPIIRNNIVEKKVLEEITIFLKTLECYDEIPVAVKHYLRNSTVNAMWSILMGSRLEYNEPKLRELTALVKNFPPTRDALVNPVLLCPWLSKRLPKLSGYNDKAQAAQSLFRYLQLAFDEPLNKTIDTSPEESGQKVNVGSFKDVYVHQIKSPGIPCGEIFVHTTGAVFLRTVDTVSTALEWLLIYLARNPKVQDKLQKEIDEKLGSSIVKNEASHSTITLPYMEACLLELHRLSALAISPLGGILQRALNDVEFNSFKIPRNTHILANLYGIHYDQKIWGDPYTFRPDRFLQDKVETEKERSKEDLKEFLLQPFSLDGERNCICDTLIQDIMRLYVTRIFQNLTVSIPDSKSNYKQEDSSADTDSSNSVSEEFELGSKKIVKLVFRKRLC